MPPSLLLRNARVARSAGLARQLDIEIRARRIHRLQTDISAATDGFSLDLTNHLILPGLINSHDHLEFGLFPRLGKKKYPDARSWASDIHRPEETPIRELLQIPKATRLLWGGLKNLLAGVTTVCHHGPFDEQVFGEHSPVRVVRHYGWSHSFDFSTDIREDFALTPLNAPFMLHLAEGVTDASREELCRLDGLGLLNAQTVLIHGVGLEGEDWNLVRSRGASLVWCPSSNLFTLGKTLDLAVVRSGIRVALGNDSPLTASGNLLDEIACALQLGLLPEEIYTLVTEAAAKVLQLGDGEGTIDRGGVADLIVARDTGDFPSLRLTFLTLKDLELVIKGGEVMLASDGFVQLLPSALRDGLSPLRCDDLGFWVRVDVESLWRETTKVLAAPLLVAGHSIEAPRGTGLFG
jgi:cytosine/adenosine deaminase-related metal-dependent hydrolase